MTACGNHKSEQMKEEVATVTDSVDVNLADCDITIDDIHFTKSRHFEASQLKHEADGWTAFEAKGKTDLFNDPDGWSTSGEGDGRTDNAAMLLTEIDNSKPFTLTAKVRPGFTKGDPYTASVLILWSSQELYHKFCFEQDERGNHRMVNVRTMGTSDDNNHDIIAGDEAWMKISSNGKKIAFFYSLDGKEWTMVRLYGNNYPQKLYVGLCSQCPTSEAGTVNRFRDITLTETSVTDFRLGK